MLKSVSAFASLLFATASLLLGVGLLNTALPLRATAEGFSTQLTGAVQSSYYIGFIAGSWIMPGLIRRIGHIRTFSGVAAITCVGAILHGLFIDPILWAVVRAVIGACMVGLYVVLESWLTGASTPDSRGSVFAVYMTVNLLAIAAGQFLIMPYGIENVATFAIAAALIAAALVPIAFTRLAQPPVPPLGRIDLRRTWYVAPVALGGAAATGLANGAFWLLGPAYVVLGGGDEFAVAVFMAATIAGGALLQLPVGYHSDRTDRRRVIGFMAFGSALVGIAVEFAAGRSALGLAVAGFLFGGFAFSIYSLCIAHAVDRVDTHEIVDTTQSLLLVHGVGAFFAPLFAGFLMEKLSHRSLFIYIAVVYVIFWAFVRRHIAGSRLTDESQQGHFVPVTRTSSEAIQAIHGQEGT